MQNFWQTKTFIDLIWEPELLISGIVSIKLSILSFYLLNDLFNETNETSFI